MSPRKSALVSAVAAMGIAVISLVAYACEAYRVLGVIAVGVGVCLIVLYVKWRVAQFYRLVVWACLELLSLCVLVPSLHAAGVFGEGTAVEVAIESVGTGVFLGLCVVCIAAMIVCAVVDCRRGNTAGKGEDRGVIKTVVRASGDGARQEVVIDRPGAQTGGIRIDGVGEGATVNVTVNNNYYYVDGLPEAPNADVRKLFGEAQGLYGRGEYGMAIGKLEECLKIEGDHKKRSALDLQIGNCWYDMRKYEQAAKWFEKGVNDARRGRDSEGEGASMGSLANCFLERKAATIEIRGENVRCAENLYRAALEVYKKDAYPVQYAATQNNLGTAYNYLPAATGAERAANVREAIACYEAALEIRKKDAYPVDYAMTQNNLGNAYKCLPAATGEERAANVRAAIACYEVALEIRKKDKMPQDYCATAANMGLLLASINDGDACRWLKEAYALREYLEDQGKRLERVMERVCKD